MTYSRTNLIRHFQTAIANEISLRINYVIESHTAPTQEVIDSLNSCLIPMNDIILIHTEEAEAEAELLNALRDYCQDIEDEIPSALTQDDSVDAELAALRASF